MTRRAALGTFGKLAAAAVAAMGGAGLPTLAKRVAAKRDLDREFFMRVFYDRNGKAIKVCYYDSNHRLLYCDPA